MTHNTLLQGGYVPYNYDGYMEVICTKKGVNNVRDFNRLMGYRMDFGSHSLRTSLDVRRVRVDNNGESDLWVAVSQECTGDPPIPQFMISPHESFNLGLNPSGDYHQYIWLFSGKDNKIPLIKPHIVHRQVNQLVINQGMNSWWIMDYRQGSMS